MSTRAMEDYLKVIFDLEKEDDKVATTVLADRLGVSPASVTGMVKKLAEMNLVTHENKSEYGLYRSCSVSDILIIKPDT